MLVPIEYWLLMMVYCYNRRRLLVLITVLLSHFSIGSALTDRDDGLREGGGGEEWVIPSPAALLLDDGLSRVEINDRGDYISDATTQRHGTNDGDIENLMDNIAVVDEDAASTATIRTTSMVKKGKGDILMRKLNNHQHHIHHYDKGATLANQAKEDQDFQINKHQDGDVEDEHLLFSSTLPSPTKWYKSDRDDDDEEEEEDIDETDSISQDEEEENDMKFVIDSGYGVAQEVMGIDEEMTRQVISDMKQYMRTVVYKPSFLYYNIRELCQNTHKLCAYWGAIGECESNRKFMIVGCAPVCKSCDHMLSQHRSSNAAVTLQKDTESSTLISTTHQK